MGISYMGADKTLQLRTLKKQLLQGVECSLARIFIESGVCFPHLHGAAMRVDARCTEGASFSLRFDTPYDN
jgi:hypothetical protein